MRREPSRTASATALALALVAWASGCKVQNHPPTLAPLGDQVVHVGETLTIQLTAEDGDGDDLAFSAAFTGEARPTGWRLDRVSGSAASFHWAPLISDSGPSGKAYRLRFTVEDGFGGWDQQELTLTVYRPGGVPVFLTPHGYVLDLARDESLHFQVQVKDDDSAAVNISLEKGVEGAQLTAVDEKTAEFFWRPTPEQVAAQLFYTLVFKADDRDHVPVRHEVGVVFLNAGARPDCPGTPPMISHTPPLDSVNGTLEVSATISDADSPIRFPTLYYATGDAPQDADWRSVALEHLGEDRFGASVEGLGALDGLLVHYYLTAWDNDDPTADRCDQGTRAPRVGAFLTAVYHPDSQSFCKDDAQEPDSEAAMGALLVPGVAQEHRLCPGDVDVMRLTARQGAVISLEAVQLGYPGELWLSLRGPMGELLASSSPTLGGAQVVFGPPVSEAELSLEVASPSQENLSYAITLRDLGAGCEPDAHEPDDDPLSAPTAEPGLLQGLSICPGDLDTFRVALRFGDNLDVTLTQAEGAGDLDLYVLDEHGEQVLGASQTGYDVEHVFLAAPGLESVVVAVLGFEGAANGYDLEIRTGDDQTLCVDDYLGPNPASEQALLLPEGQYGDLRLCPGDTDWFRLDLNGAETVEITLASPSGPDALVVGAQSPEGGGVQVDCSAVTDQLRCSFPAPVAGGWTWSVSAASPGAAVRYDLALAAHDPPGACTADRLEPNDGPSQASSLAGELLTHLTLCPGDDDWIRLEWPAWQPLSLYVLYPAEGPAPGLALLGSDGVTPRAEAQAYDGLGEAHLVPSPGGTFFIHLWENGEGDAACIYDLAVVAE
jgi:hypothetical protein